MMAERSTALVRFIKWYAWCEAFDGKFLHDVAELQRKIDAVQAGEMDHDEALGVSMDSEQLQEYLGIKRRRYRLPKGWHWMGPNHGGDSVTVRTLAELAKDYIERVNDCDGHCDCVAHDDLLALEFEEALGGDEVSTE